MGKILLIIAAMCLSACVVNHSAKKPSASSRESIIETIQDYRKASTAGVFSPYALKSGVKEMPVYKKMDKWWCLDSKSSKSELTGLVANHCKLQNGYFLKNWCMDKKSGVAHYKFSSNTGNRYCTNRTTIQVNVIEKTKDADVKEWMKYISSKYRVAKKSYAEYLDDIKRKKEEYKRKQQAAKDLEKLKYSLQKEMLSNLAVGNETHCGLVIQVRDNIVEVQTVVGNRWFKFRQLFPSGYENCEFKDGIYQKP